MIIIDYKDRRPIYEQIVDRFKEMILKGILEPDTQLPSVRNLAMELSMNPNTIQRAYTELERQEFIYSIKGKGSFVASNDKLIKEKRNEILSELTRLVQDAKSIRMQEEELIERIREGYKEGSKDD